MHCSIVLLTGLSACAQVGPIDAFRLNLSRVEVVGHYTFRVGTADYGAVSGLRPLVPGSLDLDRSGWAAIEGDWDRIGGAERYRFPHNSPDGSEGVEVLYDGMTYAQRVDGTGLVDARGDGVFDGVYYGAKSPFHMFLLKFPESTTAVFRGEAPTVAETHLDGRPVSVESYASQRSGVAKGWKRLDVYYDHELGYLPIYARFAKYSEDDGSATIREHFVLDARPCRAGGVVPTLWLESQVEVDDFRMRYPSYGIDSDIEEGGAVAAVVFEFAFDDPDTTDVKFSDQPLKMITTPGGPISAKRLSPSSTNSLRGIAHVAGSRLSTPSAPPLPSVDSDELNTYEDDGRRMGRLAVVCAASVLLAVALGLAAFLRLRRGGPLLVLFALQAGVSGCSSDGEATEPRLEARFEEPYVLYDGRDDSFEASLLLHNRGGVPLTIFNLSGGCSCRRIDDSALPASVASGGHLRLAVRFTASGSYEPERFQIEAGTDRGKLFAPASIAALPRHKLSPSSLANASLGEGSDWTFEVTHRAILGRDGAGPPPRFGLSQAIRRGGGRDEVGATRV